MPHAAPLRSRRHCGTNGTYAARSAACTRKEPSSRATPKRSPGHPVPVTRQPTLGSVSTTFGGVPQRWVVPSMRTARRQRHTSTLRPGALAGLLEGEADGRDEDLAPDVAVLGLHSRTAARPAAGGVRRRGGIRPILPSVAAGATARDPATAPRVHSFTPGPSSPPQRRGRVGGAPPAGPRRSITTPVTEESMKHP